MILVWHFVDSLTVDELTLAEFSFVWGEICVSKSWIVYIGSLLCAPHEAPQQHNPTVICVRRLCDAWLVGFCTNKMFEKSPYFLCVLSDSNSGLWIVFLVGTANMFIKHNLSVQGACILSGSALAALYSTENWQRTVLKPAFDGQVWDYTIKMFHLLTSSELSVWFCNSNQSTYMVSDGS